MDAKQQLRKFRKENNLCLNCGSPAKTGCHCDDCKRKQTQRSLKLYEKRKQQNCCYRCGKPKTNKEVYCNNCREAIQREKKQLREKWKELGLCSKCGGVKNAKTKLCTACLEERKRRHLAAKTKVINAYGKHCQCCGDNFIGRLTIDHIHNDGADHRRSLKTKGGSQFYHWLITKNFPPGFQVLCASCNLAKQTTGYCPHGDQYVTRPNDNANQ